MDQKNELMEELQRYKPLLEALANLFHPFIEIAVHDLKAGTLAALYHNLSQRQVGEATPLKELNIPTDQFPDYFLPYYKRNWDGRPLKCTSITLRNKNKDPIGLICVNVDTHFFQDAHQLLGAFLDIKEGENPIDLFGGDSQEQIFMLIQDYLKERQLALDHLSRKQKREIVLHLYAKGVFNYKNAVPLLAQFLKLSRASIYNYINASGKNE